MLAANRLGLAFLLLVACFLALVGYAAGSLLAAGEPVLAAVIALAGLAGVIGGVLVWLLVRREDELQEQVERVPPLPAAVVPEIARAPLRVQAMPVADLPPAYLAAVMKGAQARLDALKAQARQADLQ
jgi:hypothetical protein